MSSGPLARQAVFMRHRSNSSFGSVDRPAGAYDHIDDDGDDDRDDGDSDDGSADGNDDGGGEEEEGEEATGHAAVRRGSLEKAKSNVGVAYVDTFSNSSRFKKTNLFWFTPFVQKKSSGPLITRYYGDAPSTRAERPSA